MNVFIAIAVLLTLLVTAWVTFPLLRNKQSKGVSSEHLNAAIHRDQLRGLETDLARGVISQTDFEATRDELQIRLLEDIQTTETSEPKHVAGFLNARRTAMALGLSMPVLALALYIQLGTPAAINPAPTAQADDMQVREMIDTLAAKLKANPDNPKGWAMLARSYKVMQRFDEAEQAFIKAGDFVFSEPELLVDYADLLAMRANDIEGKPLEMVNKALSINPRHPTALMISAVAAYRRSDFKMAISQWEKLLVELDPGSPDALQVQSEIADARAKAGMPAPATSEQSGKLPPVPAGTAQGMTPEMINQMVERLAARLKSNPDDLAGWANLARAYKVQGRLDEAIAAYGNTGKLLQTDADLLTQYADAVATKSNGEFKGKAQQLIDKALSINPKHPMALMMAGQSAYKNADFKKAIGHWETVLSVLPANSAEADIVKSEIADARKKSGQ
jgi:cytochrome c-type biogenesis protein CcmH